MANPNTPQRSFSQRVIAETNAAATVLTTKAALVGTAQTAGDGITAANRVAGAVSTARGNGVVGAAGKRAASALSKSQTARAAAGRTLEAVKAVADKSATASKIAAAAPGASSMLASSPAVAAAGKVLSAVSKAAPILTLANAGVGAVRGGYEAYTNGGDAAQIAKGAAFGAVDQVTGGLAGWALNKISGTPGTTPQEAVSAKRTEMAVDAAKRETATEASRDVPALPSVGATSGGGEHKGWSNEARVASAQARGVAVPKSSGGDDASSPM